MMKNEHRTTVSELAMEALIRQVEHMALRAESARSDAQERANEHAGKIESRFDTFREEAQYLAYGQGLRREELLTALGHCRRLLDAMHEYCRFEPQVRQGLVVRLSSEFDEVRFYLLAPAGAGLRLQIAGLEILVVSASAPVGKALLGREVGDTLLLNGNAEATEWVVEEIMDMQPLSAAPQKAMQLQKGVDTSRCAD